MYLLAWLINSNLLVQEIYQDELTARDLFNVIYGQKIITDFKAGKLDQDGNPQGGTLCLSL